MGLKYKTNCIPLGSDHNWNQIVLAVSLFISVAVHTLILAKLPYHFQKKPLFTRNRPIEIAIVQDIPETAAALNESRMATEPLAPPDMPTTESELVVREMDIITTPPKNPADKKREQQGDKSTGAADKLTADELLQRSRIYIQSEAFRDQLEKNRTDKPFTSFYPDEMNMNLISIPDRPQKPSSESYRLQDGSIMIKVLNLLGGYSCFVMPEADFTDPREIDIMEYTKCP